MSFSGEDRDLVEIIGAIEIAVNSNNLSNSDDAEQRKKDKKIYVERLVMDYVNRYRAANGNGVPPDSLFGEAIKWYLDHNSKNGQAPKAVRVAMRNLVFPPLDRYRKWLTRNPSAGDYKIAV